jgi:small subunit ribosomal protein S1
MDAAESAPAEPVQEVEAAEEPAPVEPVQDAAAVESAPDEPVQEVEAAEEPAAADTSDETAAVSTTTRRLTRGDVIEGTVKETTPTSVTVDIGEEADGVIPGHELDKMTKSTLESLKEGAKVMVFVVNPSNHDGNILLSVNLALEELDWKRAEEYRQSQDVYESRVAGYNRGGLIVRFGRVRGFVPQSQMGADRRRAISGETPEERWGGMVGDHITVKVMEVDRQRNRLILSERSATRESREKRKESLIKELTVGEVRAGRVVSLEDFGAFIDIGGAEGLVHLTELSWQHVTHPRELLNVGQEVQVEVINIDRDAKRIGLSLKSQEPDPWDVIATTFSVGQLVKGTVTKLTKFGAFAQLDEVQEIEGLIHISELSERRVNHPREVVNEGDVLTLRVVKMDIRNRRLGLSLKKVNSPEYLDQDWSADLE